MGITEVSMEVNKVQCNDCNEIYLAENEKQLCPKCGGKGTILADVSHIYGNRTERRKAKKAHLPMEKYLPCPVCFSSKG